ncbi:hypothetical protein KCV06_g524, partial [Aureobasidium melanogenum]
MRETRRGDYQRCLNGGEERRREERRKRSNEEVRRSSLEFGSPWLGFERRFDVQDLRAIARRRQANRQIKVTKIERVVQAREDELEAARSGRVLLLVELVGEQGIVRVAYVELEDDGSDVRFDRLTETQKRRNVFGVRFSAAEALTRPTTCLCRRAQSSRRWPSTKKKPSHSMKRSRMPPSLACGRPTKIVLLLLLVCQALGLADPRPRLSCHCL